MKQSLAKEYAEFKCYPKPTEIFNVFTLLAPEDVKVVILGQDPYPFGGHAHGLAFSSLQHETPASLRTIFREVDRDVVRTKNLSEFKAAFPNNDLTPWVKQGVFLLNSVLTVRAGLPNSHVNLGWQRFTNAVIQQLTQIGKPKVIVLWGKEAELNFTAAMNSVENPVEGLVLKAGHPATDSKCKDKFSGCAHFSQINQYLGAKNIQPINWKLNG